MSLSRTWVQVLPARCGPSTSPLTGSVPGYQRVPRLEILSSCQQINCIEGTHVNGSWPAPHQGWWVGVGSLLALQQRRQLLFAVQRGGWLAGLVDDDASRTHLAYC